jgi:hypothetical protein
MIARRLPLTIYVSRTSPQVTVQLAAAVLAAPQERDAEALKRQGSEQAGIEPPPSAPPYSKDTFGPQLVPVILNLARAAATRPHLAEQQLYPLVRYYPKTVVVATMRAGTPVLDQLADMHPEPPGYVWEVLEEAAQQHDVENLTDYQVAIGELQRRKDQADAGPRASDDAEREAHGDAEHQAPKTAQPQGFYLPDPGDISLSRTTGGIPPVILDTGTA